MKWTFANLRCSIAWTLLLFHFAATACTGDLLLEQAVAQRCTRIEGSLTIKGDVPNLSALAELTEVTEGVLVTDASSLKSLAGLERLRSVGYLRIEGNQALESVEGLASLVYIGGALEISSNSTLRKVSGFDRLEIAGAVVINANRSLQEVAAFRSLARVGDIIYLENNGQLASIGGFPALKRAGRVKVFASTSLSAIGTFEALEELKQLSIGAVPALRSIGSFQKLQKLESIDLLAATRLQAIGPFAALKRVGGTVRFSEYGVIPSNSFPVLEGVDGSLLLEQGEAQVDMSAFGMLAEVGVNLAIGNHASLQSLRGFERLRTIGQTLLLYSNTCDGCQNGFSLSGLSGLTNIGRSLIIDTNPSLTAIAELATIQAIGHHVEITRNAELCEDAASRVNRWDEISLAPQFNTIAGNRRC